MRNFNNKKVNVGIIKYKKLSYNNVRRQINKSYEQDIIHRYSSALDILASYLKGQKITVTPEYIKSRISNLLKNQDLSRYIL